MPIKITEIGFYRVVAAAPALEPRPEVGELGVLVGLLDSKNYDQLYIEALDESGDRRALCMSGGEGGAVVFFVHEYPSDDIYYLQRPDAAGRQGVVSTTSGGQAADMPEWLLVPVDQAARGLYYYLLTGERDPALSWDQYIPRSKRRSSKGEQ